MVLIDDWDTGLATVLVQGLAQEVQTAELIKAFPNWIHDRIRSNLRQGEQAA